MTRAATQSSAPSAPRAGRIAAVQARPDGGLAILTAEIGGSGLALVDAILADRADAAEVLRTRRIELVIRLVPASQTVCRVLALPEVAGADRASLADALALLAESELPAALPWHRRAAGVLRLGGRQSALLTGWTQPPVGTPVDTAPLSSIPEVWTAEVAALSSLAHAVGPGPMVGLADSRDSTISLLAAGPTRTLGRVLRLSPSDGGWNQAIQAAWDETASVAGLEASPAPAVDGLLMNTPAGVRLGGATRDREWIARHGLAFGALALYADPDAAVSALVGLSPLEPRRQMPMAQRAVLWLSRPRHAAALAAVCVAALLLAPLAAAEARHALLRASAGPVAELSERLSESERRLAFYRLLREKRWPMTKLLADIAGAAPVGVTVESVELAQGEAVNIRATADSRELVSAFRKNLADTLVFGSVASPTVDASADGVSFQIQARVTSPFYAQRSPLDDFGKRTLAQRLYGDDAAAASAAWREADDNRDDRLARDRRSAASPPRDDPSRSTTPAPRAERQPAPAATVVPPPLSDADIAAMDRIAAMREWGTRRKASTQPGLDADVKARLAAEAEKCRLRMQEATAAGGGA